MKRPEDARRREGRYPAPIMDRKTIATSRAPGAIGPYSQAVQLSAAGGRLVFCSGQTPIDPATGELVKGDVSVQTERALDNVEAVLAAAGLTLRDVVKTTVFLAEMADFAAMNAVYGRRFEVPFPARSTVQAAGLPRAALVEIEAVAVAP